jgi:hypothetical protein
MKKGFIFLLGFLLVFLLGLNIAYAFETTVFGRGIPLDEFDQVKPKLFIDLGMHSITSDNWKTALDKPDNVVSFLTLKT